jgi:uncharacterized protein (DUF2235 family)
MNLGKSVANVKSSPLAHFANSDVVGKTYDFDPTTPPKKSDMTARNKQGRGIATRGIPWTERERGGLDVVC